MKASELRIGNLIIDTSRNTEYVIEVENIYVDHNGNGLIDINSDCNAYGDSSIEGTKLKYCKAIELTEDWMLKFGFKKINTLQDGTLVFKGQPFLYLKDGIVRLCIKTKEIAYVHELQNLIYYLTGEELTINQL